MGHGRDWHKLCGDAQLSSFGTSVVEAGRIVAEAGV